MGLKYLNEGEKPTKLPKKYLVTTKHPFDVRDSVETFNDLLDVFGTFSYYVYEDMCVKVSDEGCVYQLISRPDAPTGDRGSNIGNQFYEEEDQLYKNKDLWKRLNTEIITIPAALERAKSNLVNGALIYIANEITEEDGNVVKAGFYYCESGKDLKAVGGEVTAEQFAALSLLVDGKASKDEVTEAVTAAIGELVGTAPPTLDTIYELAAAIKDNPTVIAALQEAIGKKASQTDLDELATTVSSHKSSLEGSISTLSQTVTDNKTAVDEALGDRYTKDEADEIIATSKNEITGAYTQAITEAINTYILKVLNETYF